MFKLKEGSLLRKRTSSWMVTAAIRGLIAQVCSPRPLCYSKEILCLVLGAVKEKHREKTLTRGQDLLVPDPRLPGSTQTVTLLWGWAPANITQHCIPSHDASPQPTGSLLPMGPTSADLQGAGIRCNQSLPRQTKD